MTKSAETVQNLAKKGENVIDSPCVPLVPLAGAK
jgi:hypothetical protein